MWARGMGWVYIGFCKYGDQFWELPTVKLSSYVDSKYSLKLMVVLNEPE